MPKISINWPRLGPVGKFVVREFVLLAAVTIFLDFVELDNYQKLVKWGIVGMLIALDLHPTTTQPYAGFIPKSMHPTDFSKNGNENSIYLRIAQVCLFGNFGNLDVKGKWMITVKSFQSACFLRSLASLLLLGWKVLRLAVFRVPRLKKWKLLRNLAAEVKLELVLAMVFGGFHVLLIGIAHVAGKGEEDRQNLLKLIDTWKDWVMFVSVTNIFPGWIRKKLDLKDLNALTSACTDLIFFCTAIIVGIPTFYLFSQITVLKEGGGSQESWFFQYFCVRLASWSICFAFAGLEWDWIRRSRSDYYRGKKNLGRPQDGTHPNMDMDAFFRGYRHGQEFAESWDAAED